MSRPNPHFSERSYLRKALASASDVPANPSVRQMEALVSGGAGGSGGGGVVYATVDDEYQLSLTWQEVFDAMSEGKVVVGTITADDTEEEDPTDEVHSRSLDFVVLFVSKDPGGYSMWVWYTASRKTIEVASPDDYPVVGGII